MQDTAGTWLMTALTTAPLVIALLQTAATLPVLLFGLPADAMADIFDRRRLLLFWATWMLVAARAAERIYTLWMARPLFVARVDPGGLVSYWSP